MEIDRKALNMESRHPVLLFRHKILLLLVAVIFVLSFGIAFSTWLILNRESRSIEEDSKNILSTQTELFLEKLIYEQAANLDVQLVQGGGNLFAELRNRKGHVLDGVYGSQLGGWTHRMNLIFAGTGR